MTMKRQATRPQIDAERAARLMPAVIRIARAVRSRLPRDVELEELVGAGALGLAAAIRAHADADEVSFERLAVCRIRGAIFDALRHNDVLTRTQRARVREIESATVASEETCGAQREPDAAAQARVEEARRLSAASNRHQDIDAIVNMLGDAALSPEAQLMVRQRTRKIDRAIAQLPPRLAHVIHLSVVDHRTLKQIGEELGFSEGRACQLRSQALEQLRRHTRDTILPAA
jgi:RNA polymerase sigma factor FliA